MRYRVPYLAPCQHEIMSSRFRTRENPDGATRTMRYTVGVMD